MSYIPKNNNPLFSKSTPQVILKYLPDGTFENSLVQLISQDFYPFTVKMRANSNSDSHILSAVIAFNSNQMATNAIKYFNMRHIGANTLDCEYHTPDENDLRASQVIHVSRIQNCFTEVDVQARFSIFGDILKIVRRTL
jgi:hypothetical protein